MIWLASNWKLCALALLVAMNSLLYGLWQREVKAFDQYRIEVISAGKAAEKAAEDKEAQQRKNLEQVKDDYEKNLPEVRRGAVSAYLSSRVRTNASGGQMPGITTGQQAHDGTGKECLPDEEFIADAADDALKVAEWQDWAKRNNLPQESK